MVRDIDCTVPDCWEEGEWQIEFRKALSLREFGVVEGVVGGLE
jgi:hypothetical protein